jgi:hypothetical protein
MKPLLVVLAALMLGQHAWAVPANIEDSFLDGFKGPFPTLGGYAGTEISSTVSLLYQNDWDVNYLVSLPCPATNLNNLAAAVYMLLALQTNPPWTTCTRTAPDFL